MECLSGETFDLTTSSDPLEFMATSKSGPVGVGARRTKPVPKLPLSVFTPPNSGVGEKFPLPPSPGTIHPDSIYDASVSIESLQSGYGYTNQLVSGLVLTVDSPEVIKDMYVSFFYLDLMLINWLVVM